LTYNTKPKLILDIMPAGSTEDLNLKTNNSDHIEVEFQYEEPLTTDTSGSTFDNLLSNIIKEKIPSHEELAAMMDQSSDPLVELASVGARFNGDFRPASPAGGPVLISPVSKREKPKSDEDDFHKRIIDQIREPVSVRVARSVNETPNLNPALGFIKEEEVISDTEARVADFYLPRQQARLDPAKQAGQKPVLPAWPAGRSAISVLPAKPSSNFKSKPLNFATSRKRRFFHGWIFIIIALGLLAYGLTLKNELVREGFSALDNLQQARESLKNYNFSTAAKNFNDSYDDFTKASQNLNLMGAGLIGIFGDLPGFDKLTAGGLSKLKSAKDIVEAGKLLAGAGQAMSEAVSSLSQTGSILNPSSILSSGQADKNKIKPSRLVAQIKDALQLSDKNLQKAKILLADIDDSVIPEDKRSSFHDFKDKIPLFEQYLGDAMEYADFLGGIIGIDEPKKYLLLFENNSELRPTGGFPGTYGVVSFASGGLSDFFVNDVYNLDGQLKRNIVPPKQLQHITPNWGMRDSAWFIDFPTSAKKAMWFFEQESGYGVDGVITVNPDIVSAILSIVGPIKLSEYDITLTADNFRDAIQAEVEYGPNRTQPKQVVADFAPLFLEKLYSADSEKWMKIFNVLIAGLDEKDILFYFSEKSLEEFSIKKGYGGEVKNFPAGEDSDYMMVTFSNIKGSKTDAVTDSDIDIESRIENGNVIHKVILSRQHKGGDQEHGFYNRQNPAYVRILLPKNSELVSISGNNNPNFLSLINYNSQFGFEHDPELKKYESGFYLDETLGVDKFEESGKRGLGFWMITDPGTTKAVEFEYTVPLLTGKTCLIGLACSESGDYSFYFQKQPGLDWKNFKFSIQEPEGLSIISSSPLLNRIGDLYILDTEIKKDLNINIKFEQ